jgi:hypothetical protein
MLCYSSSPSVRPPNEHICRAVSLLCGDEHLLSGQNIRFNVELLVCEMQAGSAAFRRSPSEHHSEVQGCTTLRGEIG